MARTLSTPHTCCVMPIDQTRTALPAAAYIRAKRAMSSTDEPDQRARSSSERSASPARSSSQPVVWALMNRSSTSPSSASTLSTPVRNAMSPPVETGKKSVATWVPKMALSGFEGTQ